MTINSNRTLFHMVLYFSLSMQQSLYGNVTAPDDNAALPQKKGKIPRKVRSVNIYIFFRTGLPVPSQGHAFFCFVGPGQQSKILKFPCGKSVRQRPKWEGLFPVKVSMF